MRYLLATLLLNAILFGADLNWSSDYESVKEKAKKSEKNIYVLITSKSCQWCRKFENTTLQDREIAKRLYGEFEVVHISRDKHKIPQQFESSPVPRHYFTDAHGNILYSSLGHRGVECFDSFMDNAQSKTKTTK